MIHVLTTAWHVMPGFVVLTALLTALFPFMAYACYLAWKPAPWESNAVRNDYAYRARTTTEIVTLVNTKQEWSYDASR